MVQERETVFRGDAVRIAYEVRRVAISDQNTTTGYNTSYGGLPDTPVSANVRIFDRQLSAFIVIDPPDGLVLPAEIIPQTGSNASDRGAIVSFLMDSTLTDVAGTYTIYLQCVFADGVILTENRQIRVAEYR